MAQPFTFSTRDWFWLSFVLCLAIGWGTHVRYSSWWENYLSSDRRFSNEDSFRKLYGEASDENRNLRDDNSAMRYAISETLTGEQKRELEKQMEHYKEISKLRRAEDNY